MIRRWRSPLFAAASVAAGLGIVAALAGPGGRPAMRLASHPTATQSARPAFQLQGFGSCKPSPPVQLTLDPAPGGRPDSWVLNLQGLAPATQVVVSMWTSSAAGATPASEVWRGAVPTGGVRRLEAQLVIPADATNVWAAAEVVSASGAVQRSVATLPTPQAQVLRAQTAAPPGHLLVDPATGGRVLEFSGRMEGKP